MSEERVGAEVNMDEYMKVKDYDPNGDGVVEKALNASNCDFAKKAYDASNLGSRSAADYVVKSDLQEFQNTINTVQTTANNAQTSATQAQGTATNAAVTAAEAKCTATAAQTTANEAKTGLNSKVDKIAGKQLSTNDYTTAEKTKLAGIEAGANKYVHPETHPAGIITGLPEIAQETGPSTTAVMSQNAVTTALNGKVTTVNGQRPDASGNAQITTVENATKLGNQPPAYYATKTAVDTAQTAASNAQATANGAAKAAESIITGLPKVVQGTGSSTTAVMSQKVVTEQLAECAKTSQVLSKGGGTVTGSITLQNNVVYLIFKTSNGKKQSHILYNATDAVDYGLVLKSPESILLEAPTIRTNSKFESNEYRLIGTNRTIKGLESGQIHILANRGLAVANETNSAHTPVYASNVAGSAKRLKENIRTLELEDARKVFEMTPVSFTWKEESGWEGDSISFVADDVEKIDERFVYNESYVEKEATTHIDEKTGKIIEDEAAEYGKRVGGLQINPFLAAYGLLLQDHEKRIAECEAQKAKIADLENRLRDIENRFKV